MMNSRHCLECAFPDRRAAFAIELLTESAPISSSLLLGLLPMRNDTFHSKWNGAEVFLVLPPMKPATAENLVGSVQTGDVVLFHRDATYRGAPKKLRASGLGSHTELGFFYGKLIRAYGPGGPVTGTRVGRIVEGLQTLEKAAQTMRREGFSSMTISLRG